MNHPSGRAPDGDLTAKARIRNAALELYAANGEDRTSMRAVSARAGVIVGLVVHHFGSKDGLREAVEQLIVESFASAIPPTPAHSTAPVDSTAPRAAEGRDLASVRDEAVATMLAENPESVDYLRRALLETGTARGHLLERLTELTHREVVAMRESGAASRGRPDSVQVIDVLVNQLGRLFLQPLVDSAWSHLGNFTHTDDRNKPELTVQSRGDRPGGKPAGAPTDDPDSAPDGPQ